MTKRFSLFIARRYFLSKYSNSTVNFISWLSLLGIAFVSMTVILVMSVFNGLEKLQIERADKFFSDVRVEPNEGKWLHLTSEQIDQINALEWVRHSDLSVEHRAFIQYKTIQVPIRLRGVHSDFFSSNQLDNIVVYGDSLNSSKSNKALLIGQQIALDHGIILRDFQNPIKLFAPKVGQSVTLNPRNQIVQERAFSIGLFDISTRINKEFIFCHMPLAQALFRLQPDEYSYIDIRTSRDMTKPEVAQALRPIMGEVRLLNFQDHNNIIIKVIKTERIMSFLICLLILFIATFNIIGSMTMLILDKKDNLISLSQMGMSTPHIKQIFVWESVIIGIVGMVAGTLMALVLIYLQHNYSLIRLGSSSMAYPVITSYGSIVLTAVSVISLSLLAGYFSISNMSKRMFR